jgi:F-type H+-transporting ATPase subunit b
MENLAKLGINLSWLIAQIVNFILILLILRAFAYKPILKLLADRKRKIQESLDYAEKVKAESAAQQAEFEKRIDEARREASQTAASAQQVAEKEKERIVADAREEARQIVEQARAQLDYERRQMVSELREQVVNLSLLAAQKVIGASLDEKRSRQLVNEFLAEADFGDGQKVPA